MLCGLEFFFFLLPFEILLIGIIFLLCVYIYTYMCTYMYMYVCMYVFMCVCVGLWPSYDDGL